jgi:hypothetical protein
LSAENYAARRNFPHECGICRLRKNLNCVPATFRAARLW